MMMKKIILHLCADIGSDSRYYQLDDNYKVIKIGVDVGVENFSAYGEIHGIIANPPCTEFSTAGYDRKCDIEKGMGLVNHCMRIIEECNPKWYVIENPARGTLHKFIGKADHKYQPWEYGSPWTKHTALWGSFNMPKPLYTKWEDVPKNPNVYVRPSRPKPSLAVFHKNDIRHLPEYAWAASRIMCDADIRSLCSDGFAREFYKANP
jgi:hypothetical protein